MLNSHNMLRVIRTAPDQWQLAFQEFRVTLKFLKKDSNLLEFVVASGTGMVG